MKTIVSGLLALSVLAGAVASASVTVVAAERDCKVKGWTDGQTTRPIFECPDQS